MHIIKLSAIESTNSYLRELNGRSTLKDFTVVWADEQTSGRGQRENAWVSEGGKNLTMSVLHHVDYLKPAEVFRMSMWVSLGLIQALDSFKIPELAIKWPNDILSGSQKLCGILIENIIQGQGDYTSIIGIGLNINQTEFSNLPRASSMKLKAGRSFDRNEVMMEILHQLQQSQTRFLQLTEKQARNHYERYLFRKGIPMSFVDTRGNEIIGEITGVGTDGRLMLKHADGKMVAYQFQELRMNY